MRGGVTRTSDLSNMVQVIPLFFLQYNMKLKFITFPNYRKIWFIFIIHMVIIMSNRKRVIWRRI
jgi:hypothetical protein